MTKVKTSKLTGAALDWAVWNCTGGAAAYPKTASGKAFLKLWKGNSAKYIHPSTDWAQGGPIIEREQMDISFNSKTNDTFWTAYSKRPKTKSDHWPIELGQTPLIAAMRCYVASKLGDWVEIPDELLQ